MSLLEFTDVTFGSDGNSILKDISAAIQPGDFISLVGPSGSGKSTLLKLCAYLISPTGGTITFKGRDCSDYDPMELRKSIVYCFQTPYLFGDTVMENIHFPFSIRGIKPDNKRIEELFTAFRMPVNFMEKDVKTLSGGEKQRLALIRSLLFKPEILLLDEVTSALDVENTGIVEKVISSLNEEGVAVLWVTHNPEQSRRFANRLISLEAGRISAEEVLR